MTRIYERRFDAKDRDAKCRVWGVIVRQFLVRASVEK